MLSITLSIDSFAYDLEERVETYVLKNGLKVLVVERHAIPTVSLYISHKAGGVDDISGQTGTAHFLEHLMFKGTPTIGSKDFTREKKVLSRIYETGTALDDELKKGDSADGTKIDRLRQTLESLQDEGRKLIIPSEIDRIYTLNGGVDLNASTGYDLTTYHVSLPSNKTELWARIESERLASPVFREFFTERNVIMEERKQTIESDPGRKLVEQFLATAYMVHPYRRPVIGWPADMKRLAFDNAESFFTTYYAPNNTVITAVGDVSPDDFFTLVENYFGHLEPRPLPVRAIPEEPVQMGERTIVLNDDAAPQLVIGFHKPTLPSRDDYIFDVIDVLLSEGRTSRLYHELVEGKKMAESITTANGLPGARYPNLFVIFAEPRQPFGNRELKDAIYSELERLSHEPVGDRELEKAKNRLKADFLRRLSSNGGLAAMLSYFETVANDYRYITKHSDMIDTITAEDIMHAAAKYFTAENRTVAELLRPEGG